MSETSAKKRPAFQFYPGDWRRDTALQSCSLLARGLWHEMMCIMHDGEPYGHLAIGGRAINDQQLARMVGESVAVVRHARAELDGAGVFSRTDDGTIFSRRMVRDERLREVRAASGRLGGNPDLLNRDGSDLVNQTSNQTVKQKPTPASAFAVAAKEPSALSSKPAGFDLAPDLPLPEKQTPDPSRLAEAQCIQRLWGKYLTATGRDGRLLTLTNQRKNKGLARLRECLRKTCGDLERAEVLMEIAIERLAASDFHMGRDPRTGGKRYCEWEAHLFPNAEKLEFWLSDEREVTR